MHFLRVKERERWGTITRPIAGVAVQYERDGKQRNLVLCTPDDVKEPIGILRGGVKMCRVPDDVKVLDPATRKPIKASKSFWVSLETFDPFHMVIDAEYP